MAMACGIEIKRAGKLRMLALLCSLARATISFVQQRADLMSWYLFAVIDAPFPLPQIIIPKSTVLEETSFATG